jgi:hypothetical protein
MLAAEYYNSFKTRKAPITRPDQIPPTSQELVNSIMKEWNTAATLQNEVIAKSALRFRSQTIAATNCARVTIQLLFSAMRQYFINQVLAKRSTVQSTFDVNYSEFVKRRNANRIKLTPMLADRNREEKFNTLLAIEQSRQNDEGQLFQQFRADVIECERSVTVLFINRLNELSGLTLTFFDKFMLLDDLLPGEVEDGERKTIKELLKDDQRRIANTAPDAKRPFTIRQWPMLPLTITVLGGAPLPPSVTQSSSGEHRSDSKRKHRSRSKTPSESVQPETSGSSMSALSSLDTLLHRGVIVERNKCYTDFETDLKSRIDMFDSFCKRILDEINSFKTNWSQCIGNLTTDSSVFVTNS